MATGVWVDADLDSIIRTIGCFGDINLSAGGRRGMATLGTIPILTLVLPSSTRRM